MVAPFIPTVSVNSISRYTVSPKISTFVVVPVLKKKPGFVALLSGFHATIYDNGNKNKKIQALLDRSWKVLDKLPASLLKCQLLVACYAETFDDELAKEAHTIINGWEGRDLTLAEREVFDYLESLEANPYPNWEEIE